MRNVGDEFFLVILGACDLTCHERQGGSQITDLILTVYLKFIMQIACRVLLGGCRDLAQRQIDHFCKENQNDQRQQEKNHEHNIGNIQQAFAGSPNICHGDMDDNIALNFKIGSDGRKYTEHFLLEAAEKVTNRIKGTGGDGRVKIFHARLMIHIQRCFSCHDNTSGWINDPDLGGQVGAERIQLFFDLLEGNIAAV